MASADHFDPLHQLVKTRYGDEAAHHCDICLSKLAGDVGHSCRACNMDLHDACSSYFKETISFFAHPWHTLKLSRMPIISGADGMRWGCDLCMEEFLPGSFVYRCSLCLFDVHPLCTMIPQTIRIPQHPEHDFRIVAAPGDCSLCEKPLPVWHYVCPCAARLHIGCAAGVASAADQDDDDDADEDVDQTTSSGSSAVAVSRPRRRTAVAKFLLKTSIRIAIDAATGGTASPVLDILSAIFS